MRVRLHPSGPEVTRIIPGLMNLAAWDLTPAQRLDWIEATLDLGLTTFDHADIYGGYTCEALFGEALALRPGLRQQMELVTKCNIALVKDARPDHRIKHYNTSASHIRSSVARSLKNLNTDYLDLLLLHRPDPLLNPHEVAEAFYEMHRSGQVRAFGVSNFTPGQIDALQAHLDLPLVTNQVQASPLYTDTMLDGTFDHAVQHGYSPMAWSPLGGGRLFSGNDDQASGVRQVISEIAENHNAGLDQVALAFVLGHPAGICPVLGTGKTERLHAAAEATQLTLDRQEWYAILKASRGFDVP
ncbi:MAG: aldo/keto reductase [Bacteroidota bacterium]